MLQTRAARQVASRPKSKPKYKSMADVLEALGNIPAERVCFDVEKDPGLATERDLLRYEREGDALYELIDGFIVEKPVGKEESFLAGELLHRIAAFLDTNDLGYLCPPDLMVRIRRRLVRLPDMSFFTWKDRSDRTIPRESISSDAPDLIVEVLSKSNTREEIDRKLREFFSIGTRLIWVINPRTRTAKIYTSANKFTELSSTGTLDGGDVLPGFKLPLSLLFARLGPTGKRRKKSK
jgi:Uma2 family endonuclease